MHTCTHAHTAQRQRQRPSVVLSLPPSHPFSSTRPSHPAINPSVVGSRDWGRAGDCAAAAEGVACQGGGGPQPPGTGQPLPSTLPSDAGYRRPQTSILSTLDTRH
eukprot:854059-Rhodomonas_salina.1